MFILVSGEKNWLLIAQYMSTLAKESNCKMKIIKGLTSAF